MSESGAFVSDIKAIRQRARQDLEQGAVTKNYGGNVKEAIDLLNHAVATEIVCVLRYKFHAVCATGLASESVKEEFAQHAREEEEHLNMLAERINRPYRTMIRCFLGAALGIWFVPILSPSVPLFTVIGLLLALPAGLIMALPGKSVRPERLAIAMGIYFPCHYGGIGLLSALAGYTRDLTGSPAAPLWFAGAMLIFATLMLMQYRSVYSRTADPAGA